MTTYSTADYEDLGREAVVKPSNCVWDGPSDDSNPDDWALTFTRHRDSGLLDRSNFHVIAADLLDRFPDDVETQRFSHWAFGHMDHVLVRVFTEDGDVTDAFRAAVEWRDSLSDYPVASDSDYSRREYEETVSNIENNYSHLVRDDAPDDWAETAWSWFWEHDQEAIENRDDQGGFPDEDQMTDALQALDLLDPDSQEDEQDDETVGGLSLFSAPLTGRTR